MTPIEVTIENNRDWVDYAILISPFILLLLTWIASWFVSRWRIRNENSVRLGITTLWLGELKNNINVYRPHLLKYRDQVEQYENNVFTYHRPTFPISDLLSLDFESNFKSHVIGVKNREHYNMTFYRYRQLLHSLQRFNVTLDLVTDAFNEKMLRYRDETGVIWSKFQKQLVELQPSMTEPHEESQLKVKIFEIQIRHVQKMQGLKTDTWTRDLCNSQATEIMELLLDSNLAGDFIDVLMTAKAYTGAHNELVKIHQESARVITDHVTKLDKLVTDIDGLVTDYTKIKLKWLPLLT